MRQLRWEQLANQEVSSLGAQALEMNPRAWYHGETENFIIHYRNFGDALQIAREIEFDLWYVAATLGATKQQYAHKSHIYVFQDDREWQVFVKQSQHPEPWATSFTHNGELFLNIHGTGRGFESQRLAHETAHAVVTRIYGNRHWPPCTKAERNSSGISLLSTRPPVFRDLSIAFLMARQLQTRWLKFMVTNSATWSPLTNDFACSFVRP